MSVRKPETAWPGWLAKSMAAKPLVVVAIVAFTGLAAAAITLTYTTSSTVTTSVAAVPVQFLAGTDAGPSALGTYVSSYSISTNRTHITTTLKGVPEASVVMGSFFRLQNVDTASHAVTLATPQVTNAYVTAYRFEVYDASDALQATLDLKAGAPSATFTMPAGSTYTAKLTLTLASGAGADNVALTNALTMGVA